MRPQCSHCVHQGDTGAQHRHRRHGWTGGGREEVACLSGGSPPSLNRSDTTPAEGGGLQVLGPLVSLMKQWEQGWGGVGMSGSVLQKRAFLSHFLRKSGTFLRFSAAWDDWDRWTCSARASLGEKTHIITTIWPLSANLSRER